MTKIDFIEELRLSVIAFLYIEIYENAFSMDCGIVRDWIVSRHLRKGSVGRNLHITSEDFTSGITGTYISFRLIGYCTMLTVYMVAP